MTSEIREYDFPDHPDLGLSAGINFDLALRMKEARIASLAELGRRLKAEGSAARPSVLSALYQGRLPARHEDGTWSDTAVALSDLFGCLPDDLFDAEHQWRRRADDDCEAILRDELSRREDAHRSAETAYEETETAGMVSEVLATLTPREERILRLRFGIGAADALTRAEIGLQFGVTCDRIQQIETKSLRKLKHPSRSGRLRTAFYGHLPEPRISPAPRQPKPANVAHTAAPSPAAICVAHASPHRKTVWPVLRNYGVELALYVLPNGAEALVVRNDPDVPSSTLAPAQRGLRHRADHLYDALSELGFDRHSSGMWIDRTATLSVEAFLRALPMARSVEVALNEVTVAVAVRDDSAPSHGPSF